MARHINTQSLIAFAHRTISAGHRVFRVHTEIQRRLTTNRRPHRSQMCLHCTHGMAYPIHIAEYTEKLFNSEFSVCFMHNSIVTNIWHYGMRCIVNWWNKPQLIVHRIRTHRNELGACWAFWPPTLAVLMPWSRICWNICQQQHRIDDARHTAQPPCAWPICVKPHAVAAAKMCQALKKLLPFQLEGNLSLCVCVCVM